MLKRMWKHPSIKERYFLTDEDLARGFVLYSPVWEGHLGNPFVLSFKKYDLVEYENDPSRIPFYKIPVKDLQIVYVKNNG